MNSFFEVKNFCFANFDEVSIDIQPIQSLNDFFMKKKLLIKK